MSAGLLARSDRTAAPPAPVLAPRLVLAVTTGLAVAMAVAFLLLPLMGTDLAAAQAHADFAREAGLTPLDLRWYGGTNQLGYSLWAQFVTAALGVRTTGALSAVVASVAFADLLHRTGARRPLLGALAGTICVFANLVSGRVTYALGLAVGLLALVALVRWLPRSAAALALLSAVTSPVAGLFLGLAGTVLMLTGRRSAGLTVAVPAAGGLSMVGLLFGQGGVNTPFEVQLWHPVVVCLLVAALVPRQEVRLGALLAGAGVVVALLIPNPVAGNALRLPVMFALPVLLGYARLSLLQTVAAGVAVTYLLPPVQVLDWKDRGSPALSANYFAPLLGELDRLPLTGRVEVPPLRDYGESTYVAGTVPLARGWLRQLDSKRNPLFFDGPLDPVGYRAWLEANAVQYVALADAERAWVAATEVDLLRGGLPYLAPVWRDAHWTLYAVHDPTALVDPPAQVVEQRAASLSFTVPGPGRYRVRVPDSRWLSLTGPGCLLAEGDDVVVHARAAGLVTLGSSLLPGRDRC